MIFAIRTSTLLLLGWLSLACGGGAAHQIAYDTRSHLAVSTPDGLHRIRNSRIGGVYVRPGADLSVYERVVLVPTTVVPREARDRSAVDARPQPDTESKRATRDQMARIVREAIEQEFGRSSAYTVASEGGPGVLQVASAVLEFVLDADHTPVGEWSLGGRVGDMTLVLDVRDAGTGQALARFVDRPELRLQSGSGGVTVQGPGAVWGLVRSVVAHWARASREELDALHQARIPPLADAR